jgi:hypothetical protein
MTGIRLGRIARVLTIAAASAALVTVVPASAAHKSAGGKSYQAPFKVGSTGGDSFSYHNASKDGTVTVGRIYPIPGAINCTKGGPWGMLYVDHKATKPVHKVVVSYTSAAVDNFTFAIVSLRDPKHNAWYGTTEKRGFLAGSGKITLKPDGGQGHLPRTLRIQFGLQQSSACPNADAGTIQFTKVQVS